MQPRLGAYGSRRVFRRRAPAPLAREVFADGSVGERVGCQKQWTRVQISSGISDYLNPVTPVDVTVEGTRGARAA
jgi:hypothetical protein